MGTSMEQDHENETEDEEWQCRPTRSPDFGSPRGGRGCKMRSFYALFEIVGGSTRVMFERSGSDQHVEVISTNSHVDSCVKVWTEREKFPDLTRHAASDIQWLVVHIASSEVRLW